MHIEITYHDGDAETVEVRLEADRVLGPGGWRPGHAVGNPVRCYFMWDFFEAAIEEGGVRSGSEAPDKDELDAFEPFSWKLVGSDEEECRALLGIWAMRIGRVFDPHGDPSALDISEEEKKSFIHDQKVWTHYLEDPAAALESVLAETASVRP